MTECIKRVKEVAVCVMDEGAERRNELLRKCASTSLNSKIISKYKEYFADMVVKAVEHLDQDLDKSDIGIKKVTGGSVTDSFLV